MREIRPKMHTTRFSASYEDLRALCEILGHDSRMDHRSKAQLLKLLPREHPAVLDALATNGFYCRESQPELFELGLDSIRRLLLDDGYRYYRRMHRERLQRNVKFYRNATQAIARDQGTGAREGATTSHPRLSPLLAPRDATLRAVLAEGRGWTAREVPADEFDWRDAVIYFVLVDRFCRGSGAAVFRPVGPPVLEPADWQGGNWRGVIDKIQQGYFTDLGVNTLWITCPMANAEGAELGVRRDDHWFCAYHGYWPIDVERHEERLGSESDLVELVDVAHRHRLKVLLDYVMRHVHIDSKLYAEHPDWFWPNENGKGEDCVCGDGCCWQNERNRCWFADYLPAFDFNNEEARKFSVGNAIDWLERTGADGLRLDAVRHIEDAWLLDLRTRLEAELQPRRDHRVYLVGETFTGFRPEIAARVREDMLDGQFDFPLRAELIRAVLLRTGSMRQLAAFMDENDQSYWPGAVMCTFLGNHDVPRIVHFAQDHPPWGDDAWADRREETWTTPPSRPKEHSAFERLANAYTVLFTTRGAPLIYYGDEWGIPGVGDPDCRRFMQWEGYAEEQVFLCERIALLAKLRAQHPVLRRGTRTTLTVDDDIYAYRMALDDATAIVVINRADELRTVEGLPEQGFRNLLDEQIMQGPRLAVPARSSLVLVPSST